MSTMRVAVAGSGALVRHIAYFIHEYTSHNVLILSRTAQPHLTAAGFQVFVVDYANPQALAYAVMGIDTVISTVTGPNQIHLINAAVRSRVRRFAPAEFEGPPGLRPVNNALDRGHAAARQLLASYSQVMNSTTFVCGVFYERFQPFGLCASRIGLLSNCSGEGDYLVNVRTMRAHVPSYDANGTPDVTICMTSVQDVARFITRALDIPEWPEEFRIYGCRIRVNDLLARIAQLRGQRFSHIQGDDINTLRTTLHQAIVQQDPVRMVQTHTLLATAAGHYNFDRNDWNRLFPNEQQPVDFFSWLASVWQIPRA